MEQVYRSTFSSVAFFLLNMIQRNKKAAHAAKSIKRNFPILSPNTDKPESKRFYLFYNDATPNVIRWSIGVMGLKAEEFFLYWIDMIPFFLHYSIIPTLHYSNKVILRVNLIHEYFVIKNIKITNKRLLYSESHARYPDTGS